MTTQRFRVGTPAPLPAIVLLVLTAGACRVGGNPARSPAATAPTGADVSLWGVGGASIRAPIRGELLAVGGAGVYVLTSAQVQLYPFGTRWKLRPSEAPGAGTVGLDRADPTDLEALARYARHPFGLDEEGLRRLLDTMSQDSVVVRDER